MRAASAVLGFWLGVVGLMVLAHFFGHAMLIAIGTALIIIFVLVLSLMIYAVAGSDHD